MTLTVDDFTSLRLPSISFLMAIIVRMISSQLTR
jgi:hypothetical protein